MSGQLDLSCDTVPLESDACDLNKNTAKMISRVGQEQHRDVTQKFCVALEFSTALRSPGDASHPCRDAARNGGRQTSVPLTTLSTDIMSVWVFKAEGNLADKQLLRRKTSMPSTDGCRQTSTDMNSRAELTVQQT